MEEQEDVEKTSGMDNQNGSWRENDSPHIQLTEQIITQECTASQGANAGPQGVMQALKPNMIFPNTGKIEEVLLATVAIQGKGNLEELKKVAADPMVDVENLEKQISQPLKGRT